MTSTNLLARLWPIAASPLLACGAPTPAPVASHEVPGPSPASSAAPAASSMAARTAPAVPTGTPTCHEGAACVVGSSCFFVTQRNGDIPNTGVTCQCDDQGQMRCPYGKSSKEKLLVCAPKTGPGCPVPGSPQGQASVNAQFEPGCPMLLGVTSADERKYPSGEPACCYQASLGLCQGRPLILQGRPCLARLQAGLWG